MSRFVLTNHAKKRLSERGITLAQIKQIVLSDNSYFRDISDGKELAVGVLNSMRTLQVVYKKERSIIIIITAYYII